MPEGGMALGLPQEYKMTLVGTGSLGGVDPDRIILKKVRNLDPHNNQFLSCEYYLFHGVSLKAHHFIIPGDINWPSDQS